MATIDRFRDALNHDSLTAQMKYDYLAAIHTMEQLTTLAEQVTARNEYRAKLRADLLKGCCQTLREVAANEDKLTLKKIDATIRELLDCRRELLKIDCATKECNKLAEFIRDGISAGH